MGLAITSRRMRSDGLRSRALGVAGGATAGGLVDGSLGLQPLGVGGGAEQVDADIGGVAKAGQRLQRPVGVEQSQVGLGQIAGVLDAGGIDIVKVFQLGDPIEPRSWAPVSAGLASRLALGSSTTMPTAATAIRSKRRDMSLVETPEAGPGFQETAGARFPPIVSDRGSKSSCAGCRGGMPRSWGKRLRARPPRRSLEVQAGRGFSRVASMVLCLARSTGVAPSRRREDVRIEAAG